jgi:hypothetical protein
MSELLAGVRVRISSKSKFYLEPSNPTCDGTIETEDDLIDGWIGVNWDNGDWNMYRDEDLIIISDEDK